MKKTLLFILMLLCFLLVGCDQIEKDTSENNPSQEENIQKEVKLDSIYTSNEYNDYVVGDSFTKGDIVVTAKYSDKTTKDVTNEAIFDVNYVDFNQVGIYAIIVKYENKNTSFVVSVKSVENITISGQKDKFLVGDPFETGNLKVMADYSDGSSNDVTKQVDINFSNVQLDAVGEYEVQITYKDKNISYKVTVSKKLESIELNTDGVKQKYYVGDIITTGALVVIANYSDETKEILKNYFVEVKNSSNMVIEGNLTTPGIYTVDILYEDKKDTYEIIVVEKEENEILDNLSTEIKQNISMDGYVKNQLGYFEKYVGTQAYRQVSTPEELVQALLDAKYHYKNVWDYSSNTYYQLPADGYTATTMLGSVHVIEIMNDLNLGYYKLSNSIKQQTSIVEDFCRKTQQAINTFKMSDMFTENGISQFKIENTSNLLIYSKNGAKLTHCGFKLTSDNNVVFRNLNFDEIWQWEDVNKTGISKVGDYDAFGWAYFKISFCGYVWIDHCSFGKSYDGQIDYSNPDYSANAGVAFRAPFGASGENGLHISWCSFNSGSDDPDGYLYKMMEKIEQDYQNGGTEYLYYNKLRSIGATFEDILYGIAIPQKKGFLCGDSGNNKEDYEYNLKLQISFANCVFKNLEDRIPKLRGGNAYIYNCLIDSLQYFSYRTKLRELNAKSAIESMGWKCGLVSQGIVCGNGGSIKAENCIFRGIDDLLKNNDSNTADKIQGGYQLVNCSYQRSSTSEIVTSGFPNVSTTILKESNFSWHTSNQEAPFTITPVELDRLESYLYNSIYGVGHKNNNDLNFIKLVY